jgi:small subunit ribosomal protein S17
MSEKRKTRRVLEGTVVRTKAQNTIGVMVDRRVKHARYGKYITIRKNYLVHDADGVAQLGDTVEMTACRPMSKLKRWRLTRVVSHSALAAQGQSPDKELAAAADEQGGEA